MKARPESITASDLALLEALAEERTVVAASRRVGFSRDRANYRIARLERAFGGPVVAGRRGGREFGGSRLTALGDRIVRRGFNSIELLDSRPVASVPRSNVVKGTFRSLPAPALSLSPRLRLRVAFAAEEGERVTCLLDPESILVSRERFASSARNVVRALIEGLRPRARDAGVTIFARLGPLHLRVAVTEETVRRMRLRRGARVWLHMKATALRRVGRVRRTRPSEKRSGGAVRSADDARPLPRP
jgi:molybdate transport repressor ModE-like protein/molybdopterin-binding protein